MFNLLGDTLNPPFDMLENNDNNYELNYLYDHQSPEELNVPYANMSQYLPNSGQQIAYPEDFDSNQYQYSQPQPYQAPIYGQSLGAQSSPSISSSQQSPTQNVYQYYSQPVMYQPGPPFAGQYSQGTPSQVHTPVSATSAPQYPFYGNHFDSNAGNSYQNSPYQDVQYSSSNVSKDYSPVVKQENSPSIQKPIHNSKKDHDVKAIIGNTKNRYRVIRGIAAGGCSARPPKTSSNSNCIFLPIELNIIGGGLQEICLPQWSRSEKEDKRRIVRIERLQKGPKLYVNFSIVGSANENPTPLPPPPNMDIIEVSCLECSTKLNEEINESSEDDYSNSMKYENDFYITSVEVIEIVELLIGTSSDDAAERRKERGRVRSNLVPFWGKKPISSRVDSAIQSAGSPDYRIELAKRIMGYEIRKPRGFDKEVRILKWEKLIPALKRALQSYYCEVPQDASFDF